MSTVSKRVRSRGRGKNAEERARSRAAFKAWDTRRAEAIAKKRSAAAKKAAKTRAQSIKTI